MDIIETSEGSRTGYLAVRPIDYADCIANILYNTEEQNETIRNAARFVRYNFNSFIILQNLFVISPTSLIELHVIASQRRNFKPASCVQLPYFLTIKFTCVIHC